MKIRDYDSTVARIAGNIASGISGTLLSTGAYRKLDVDTIASDCVELARAIIDETRRTEPAAELRKAADRR